VEAVVPSIQATPSESLTGSDNFGAGATFQAKKVYKAVCGPA